MAELIFWILFFVIIYAYLGYGLLLIVIRFFKRLFGYNGSYYSKNFEPAVTIVIAAYNEKEFVSEKVENLRQLDYPKEKIEFLWITDGSNDGSPEMLSKYPDMHVAHENARNGKVGALNRGMAFVKTPIVVFCDANNFLAKESIREIVGLFANPYVGCVAGEKRIQKKEKDIAAGAGEGFYWHYESFLKKLESEVNSTVGAAGELFAIRRELYEPVERDTLLDDFIISLRIAKKGYKIKYAPEAIAVEASSASIEDELKRKVRIAAGTLQSIPRLLPLLNPFLYGFFSIQYWSHKILRWTFVPAAMLLLIPLNIYLSLVTEKEVYDLFLQLQLLFYFLALAGFLLRGMNLRFRLLFVPYYLLMMNIAQILGFVKHMKGKQSVNWEKAKRQSS